MAEDEEETLRRLNSYRAVFSDFITRFGGRIFNTAGDAIPAEFASAVDAVRCALKKVLRTRNLAYAPVSANELLDRNYDRRRERKRRPTAQGNEGLMYLNRPQLDERHTTPSCHASRQEH